MKNYKGWITFIVVLGMLYGIYCLENEWNRRASIYRFETITVFKGEGMTNDEINRVGAKLLTIKAFAENHFSIQLRLNDRRYEARYVVKPGFETENSVLSARALGHLLSEALMNCPVDIHYCDEKYQTIRVIPFQPIRPDLPIMITFRRSVGGGGLVAQFSNTSDKYLTLKLRLTNRTLAQQREIFLNIKPKSMTENGWLEGWDYRSGETISLEHSDYESLHVKVP